DIVAVNVEQVNQLLSRIEDECLNILPLCSQTAADLRSVFDVARVNRELARISSLARVIAHQAGILAPGGLPATARDITLMADLAAAACARAVRAVLAQNAGDAHATGEERAMIDGIRDRLSTRFEEALQQPGRQVHALLAGLTVVASLVQIGDHTTRIARVVTGL
ncbi:MAG: PhoU domain-containing protein, partial [bacterium]